MSTPLLRRLAAYHSHNSINCNRDEPTQDQNQYPHHQQQQQHQLPVLQSTSKSLPYIPPFVSPLRPNRHNSVSQKRPLPPVPPNQIGSNGLLRSATYLSGFYQSPHPTSFTGSNQSDSNTQNLNKRALPSPKPLEPKRINTDNGFESSIENLPVQNLRNQQFKKPLPLPPQSSSVTLELEHDQSGVMYHPENQSQCLSARKSQNLRSEPQIPIIITEEENLDDVPKLVIPDECDDDESSSQEREKAAEEPPVIITAEELEPFRIGNLPEIIIGCEDDEAEEENALDERGDEEDLSSGMDKKPRRTLPIRPIFKKDSLNCASCYQLITGRVVHALEQRWHPDCFTCQHCGQALEHVAFYEHDGKAYCGVDYDELFSLKCHHCNTSINDESYVTLEDPSLPGGPRHYHQLHLFCAECGDPFLNPKSLEERSRISKDPSLRQPQQQPSRHPIDGQDRGASDSLDVGMDPKPFVLYKGYPYCERCDNRLHKPKCWGCKSPLLGDFVKALDKQWHADCFVCFSCEEAFHNNIFFLLKEDDLKKLEQRYSINDNYHTKMKNVKSNRSDRPICETCYSNLN
ncbi:hypothetical protein BY996DRAFT_6410064 [Phakopsora pachyrhizi]|uniref:Expressed protein n=1 Tax=Phakopsora pachyrhizi TaxID=170000 RepID=A0AAV0AY33_PHAPC|nr:hypothetical protein BY996DRAFT_6410064 [Phakopsora pachyrhizi]CAH7673545.1 expressed protein [Phakopsora pachyrhizi]